MRRFLKQFLFGLFFLAIFGGVGFWIYSATRPVLTCFDKIQNQGEEDVDCGPVCGNACLSLLKPVEVRGSYIFKVKEESGVSDHDVLFRVSNPNAQFGSAWVNYEVTLFYSQDNALLQK